MPFITEELWHRFGYSSTSILEAGWPEAIKVPSEGAEKVAVLKGVIGAIRNLRAQFRIPHHQKVDCVLKIEDESLKDFVIQYQWAIQRLARVDGIGFDGTRPPDSALIILPELEIYLKLAGILDKEQERNRLLDEATRLEIQLSRFLKELDNPEFLERARPVAVERVRARISEIEARLERVRTALASLKEE
jgi:valyl-tRNA synthetase